MQSPYLINASYGTGVPGVVSVQPDNNFESEIKDYGGLPHSLLLHFSLFLFMGTYF